MKLYSKTLVLFYFGVVMILISIGSLVEIVKEYYPILKRAILSFAKEKYGSFSKSPYPGLPAV